MLPFALLFWIVLEVAGYLAFCRLGLGVDWPLAIAVTVGCMLGARASINAITWMFGMAFASPAPRLGFKHTARLMFDEYLAFLFTFFLVIPFERLWMPADRLRPGTTPILLVHGYGCSRGVWWLLRRRLEKAGHCVASVSLFPPFTSMGKLVPQLKQRIDEVCAATGSKQVILIGHSMGGLICRSYLARHGHEQVSRLITLATPHAGAEMARIGVGQNAREMEPGSLWLRDMAAMPLKLPAISFRNLYDNYVMPQDNQRFPGMEDRELPATGHIAQLYDRRVASLVVDACASKGKKTP